MVLFLVFVAYNNHLWDRSNVTDSLALLLRLLVTNLGMNEDGSRSPGLIKLTPLNHLPQEALEWLGGGDDEGAFLQVIQHGLELGE